MKFKFEAMLDAADKAIENFRETINTTGLENSDSRDFFSGVRDSVSDLYEFVDEGGQLIAGDDHEGFEAAISELHCNYEELQGIYSTVTSFLEGLALSLSESEEFDQRDKRVAALSIERLSSQFEADYRKVFVAIQELCETYQKYITVL